jgi:hypothetical protein
MAAIDLVEAKEVPHGCVRRAPPNLPCAVRRSRGCPLRRPYAVLERKGTPIDELDTQVAAHALTLGVTLVTNNDRQFSQVAGLGSKIGSKRTSDDLLAGVQNGEAHHAFPTALPAARSRASGTE